MDVLHLPQNWDSTYYINSISGTATQTYNTDKSIMNLKSPLGTNNGALKRIYVPIQTGDEIEFVVWARAVKGDSRIGFDLYKDDGTLYQTYMFQKVVGSSFKKYKLKFLVPFFLNVNIARLNITLGTWNSVTDDSEGEFMYPKLRLNANVSSSKVFALGMVRVINGVADLHPNFRTYGVSSVTYSDTTHRITVTLKQKPNLAAGQYPIMMVTATADNFYPALAGTYDPVANTFQIALTNGTTSVSLNSGSFYVNFEVKI